MPDLATFRFSDLVPPAKLNSPVKSAAMEMLRAYDEVWDVMPLELRDFALRGMKAMGIPIDYPGLPFWVEKVARHVLFLCFPTLKHFRFDRVDSEMMGRIVGHLLAIATHAKNGTAIFAKSDFNKIPQIQRFYSRIYDPLKIVLADGMVPDPLETEQFLKGLNYAFSRTFDAVGMPNGWNTTSPVQVALCMGWKYIAQHEPSLPTLHRELVHLLGSSIVGSEDRVKKICHRVGLRFEGGCKSDRQGTSVDLSVPSLPESTSDK